MRYLLYISQNYSFEILRPLQEEILRRGGEVAWFVEGNDVNFDLFQHQDKRLATVPDVIAFLPDAVFVPGNFVPNFFPGLKVQIFHGFEWKKKGHFRIRGQFDLYCTQGPLFTKKFEQLKLAHAHFNVVETGWPKMDTLFSSSVYRWPNQNPALKTILYAPTFSPSLTSAPALFKEIARLANQHNWQWLIKFHPKMDQNWIEKFKELENENLHVVSTETLAPVLQAADILISDTSSIITEFALINRPIITFKNSSPESHLIDIQDPTLLEATIERALVPSDNLLTQIKTNVVNLHPYSDGKSSARVLDAVDTFCDNNATLMKKPANLIRNLKIRKKLKYWSFWA